MQVAHVISIGHCLNITDALATSDGREEGKKQSYNQLKHDTRVLVLGGWKKKCENCERRWEASILRCTLSAFVCPVMNAYQKARAPINRITASTDLPNKETSFKFDGEYVSLHTVGTLQ